MEPEKQEHKSDSGVVHVYDDDLIELDNRLPRWWQATLYGAIVFACFYWYGEIQLGAWKGRSESYQAEKAAIAKEEAARGGSAVTSDMLVSLSKASSTVDEGKAVFASTCAPCHRADAGGNIGPNLTDEYWIHGSKPENIYHCVHDGVPEKGMPTWGPQLGNEKVAAVVAYVLTLHDTHVANGKAPQGDKEL